MHVFPFCWCCLIMFCGASCQLAQSAAYPTQVPNQKTPILRAGQQFSGERACALVLGTHGLNQFPPCACFSTLLPLDPAMEQVNWIWLGWRRCGCQRLNFLDWQELGGPDRATRFFDREPVGQMNGHRNVIAWVNARRFPYQHCAPPEVCATALCSGQLRCQTRLQP